MLKSLEEIPFCDTFYPTWAEFKNFHEYLEKITKTTKSGIFKVVPPKGWKARNDDYQNLELTVPHPIEQIVTGKDGFFELLLIQRESRSLAKYKKLVESYDKIIEKKNLDEIEKLFWRTLKFSSPLYGADAPGSIFDKGVAWNLSELDTPLKKGLKGDITGVTTPYLYFGSWKTMFAWHKEDLDLNAINFLHFGQPKQEEEKKFSEFAAKHFTEAFKECPEFLRHKTYLINPKILVENGFHVEKCIQLPGEFVVTKCAGYHAGFNLGFNCAEAVNFALSNWTNFGNHAGICKCRSDAVKIDMKVYTENLNDGLSAQKTNHFITRQSKRAAKQKLPKEEAEKVPKRLGRPKKDLIKAFNRKVDKEVENWLCCDKCNKWRKISKMSAPKSFKNGFSCNFIKNFDCSSPEEKWRTKYTTLKRRNYNENEITKTELKKYHKLMRDSIKSQSEKSKKFV